MRNPDWVRDEIILAMDLYFRAGRKQLPNDHEDVLHLSRILNDLPIHPRIARDENFRNPNGISMILGNFLGVDPLHEKPGLSRNNHLQAVVWRDFADAPETLRNVAVAIQHIASCGDIGENETIVSDEDMFIEGALLTRQHTHLEHNRSAVCKKIELTLAACGKLKCEVCDFNFFDLYGDLGNGFAEFHHTTPLLESAFMRTTQVSDIAIVCANCHRMLHRARPALTIDGLKGIIAQVTGPAGQ